MAERVQQEVRQERQAEEVTQEWPIEGKVGEAALEGAANGAESAEATDSLLDEIDRVLETNPEEFIKNFVQRNGE